MEEIFGDPKEIVTYRRPSNGTDKNGKFSEKWEIANISRKLTASEKYTKFSGFLRRLLLIVALPMARRKMENFPKSGKSRIFRESLQLAKKGRNFRDF